MSNQRPKVVVRKVAGIYLPPSQIADPYMFPPEDDGTQVATSNGQYVWTSHDYPVVVSS